MDIDQIRDMDIVAHAGAVRGVVIGAEDGEMRHLARHRLAGALDQMGGARRGLAGAPLGIGARDIEIAQNHVAQTMGYTGISNHLLRHQL